MSERLRVAIAGAGLIGTRRARVAQSHPSSTVAVVVDTDEKRARTLANEIGSPWATDWDAALDDARPDLCVVATPHKYLSPLSVAALRRGCHVLCEKPLGRTPEEAYAILSAARERERVLKTGFNLRHHAGVARAHAIVAAGEIGRPMHIRARYGHGGRPGYDKEWRGDPELSGGGELIDQGIHILDLFRWFVGEFTEVRAFTSTAFWQIAPLEDNVFALLRTDEGQLGMLHASWTQWRNLFSLEVFGLDGYVIVEGLGGSYGPERVRLGRRDHAGGAPAEESLDLVETDPWRAEWDEFLSAVRERREPLGSGEDGWRALTLAHDIYRSART